MKITGKERFTGMGAADYTSILENKIWFCISDYPDSTWVKREAGYNIYEVDIPNDSVIAEFYRSNSGATQNVEVFRYGKKIAEFDSFIRADDWAKTFDPDGEKKLPSATIDDLLKLAAKLPSGLPDPKAPQKLLSEIAELEEALTNNDFLSALLEGADIAYYVTKTLHYAANLLNIEIEELFSIARAKYELRAKSGNPKDDKKERAAIPPYYYKREW